MLIAASNSISSPDSESFYSITIHKLGGKKPWVSLIEYTDFSAGSPYHSMQKSEYLQDALLHLQTYLAEDIDSYLGALNSIYLQLLNRQDTRAAAVSFQQSALHRHVAQYA